MLSSFSALRLTQSFVSESIEHLWQIT